MVANGHHWDPRWPEPAFPGGDVFAGGRCTRTTTRARTRSSSATSAWSCSGWATRRWTSPSRRASRRPRGFLAARRGAWVIPKYLFGRPLDQISTAAARAVRACASGDAAPDRRRRSATWSATGCRSPTTALQAHPTVSDDILSRIAHGEIKPKPNIARLDRAHGVLRRRQRGRGRHVVYCTGYKVRFPFFDEGLIAAQRQRPAALPPAR